MTITTRFVRLGDIDATWLAVGIFEGEPLPPDLPAAAILGGLVESKEITGSIGETTVLHSAGPNGASLLVFGLGKKADDSPGSAFSAGVSVSKRLSSKKRSTVAVAATTNDAARVSALVEGLVVGMAGPGVRKVEPTRHAFDVLTIVGTPEYEKESANFEAAVRRGEVIGRAVNLARELVNTPPCDKPPAALADRAVAIAQGAGLVAEVWDLARLKLERFGGVVAVASGSAHEPRFVRLEYRNAGDAPVTAIVGKGVTFDSGGLSLKPSASMEDMKCDMAGAAAVLATMEAVAKLGIKANVDAYFALTENMTGSAAMKLGDVLTMRNGMTVEVLNTDAEGRLILADVLSFAAERKPARIVDLATLTGACMVALGGKIAGLFSNHDALAAALVAASQATGERVWRMPMDADFRELIKSKVGEIKNVGGKWGGAITAAKFLECFVAETPWAHLDIAGPAWADDDTATRDAGGTGAFVRTLIALLETQS